MGSAGEHEVSTSIHGRSKLQCLCLCWVIVASLRRNTEKNAGAAADVGRPKAFDARAHIYSLMLVVLCHLLRDSVKLAPSLLLHSFTFSSLYRKLGRESQSIHGISLDCHQLERWPPSFLLGTRLPIGPGAGFFTKGRVPPWDALPEGKMQPQSTIASTPASPHSNKTIKSDPRVRNCGSGMSAMPISSHGQLLRSQPDASSERPCDGRPRNGNLPSASLADLFADRVLLLIQRLLLLLGNVAAVLRGHIAFFLANLTVLLV